MQNYIVALLGRSGSGKDTVLSELEKQGFKRVVSCTTRPIRQGEVHGVDYYFLTDEEFTSKIKDFIEYRCYETYDSKNQPCIWHYGIEAKEIDLSKGKYVVIVDYKGFKDLRSYSDKVFGIFIDACPHERLNRAKSRDDKFSSKEWERREADDDKVFSNVDLIHAIVQNIDGQLFTTMESVQQILKMIEVD